MSRTLSFYENPPPDRWKELCLRPVMNHQALEEIVREVFRQVKNNGDEALVRFTQEFDGVGLNSLSLHEEEILQAGSHLQADLKASIDAAYHNIFTFHQTQIEKSSITETSEGVFCWRESRAIERVGLYIPGGSAPLFSTVLMLAIPAQIAGCEEVILCTPPLKDGTVHPGILYAASLCSVKKIFKVGGAQAIAAMAIGTNSIPSVYKLFGPGNQYVTAAKLHAMGIGVGIDLPAGPSEVLVFADDTGIPDFVAADLLSQAEHGEDSQVLLVTTDKHLAGKVENSLARQLENLPRKNIAAAALKHSKVVFFENVDSAFSFINQYAPEHFIISSDHANNYIKKIRNAGSVFLGHYTPESAGDYASGTNHTLPTGGYARTYSGVSLDSFIKKITFQEISPGGLHTLGPHVVNMARAEHLEAHARAVEVRLKGMIS